MLQANNRIKSLLEAFYFGHSRLTMEDLARLFNKPLTDIKEVHKKNFNQITGAPLPFKTIKRKLTKEETEKAVQYLSEGAKGDWIARKLKTTPATISRIKTKNRDGSGEYNGTAPCSAT